MFIIRFNLKKDFGNPGDPKIRIRWLHIRYYKGAFSKFLNFSWLSRKEWREVS